MSDKKESKPRAASKAAFLMLKGKGSSRRQVSGVLSPIGTDGWMPGEWVSIKDVGRNGVTPAQAREAVKTGLFKIKGDEE